MTEMKYADIPNVDKKVSRILFGTAMQPFLTGGDGDKLLDAMFAAGVTTFDCARAYGGAEKSLGAWVEKRGIRDQVVILSKCAHPDTFWNKRVNAAEMKKDFEKSASELHTDYIDIYLLHRDDPDVEVGEIVETLNELHVAGKIGAFGASNWTHQRIDAANVYAREHHLIPFSVSSPNFGMAEQVQDPWGGGCVTISGAANADARKWYAENQMPVIAYSSLGRGLFSGRVRSSEPEKAMEVMDEVAMKGYGCPENFERLRRCEQLASEKGCKVPQIAMAWIFSQPVNTFAVVSTSKPERMQENIDALHIALGKEELEYLNLESEAL